MIGDKENKSDNNMKIAVTIIIVLVGLLAAAVFSLQQNRNKDIATGNTTEDGTAKNTKSTSEDTRDAGAIGKNELKLTDDNFKTEVGDYKGVVLVDFYASWCPHCKNIAKDVTEASDALVGRARVGKLDIEENSVTSSKYEIKGTPTFIVFKNGEEVERVSGEKKKQQLIDMVNKHL
jgi:thioredoxin 1